MWLTPPLMPLERKVLIEDVKPLKLDSTSTFDYSIVSPLPRERFSSPTDQYDILPSKDIISPSKISLSHQQNTFTTSGLKLETPLTPISTRKPQYPPNPPSPFPFFRSPSPPTPLPPATKLSNKLFKEEIIPEMMLRITVPEIPPWTPKRDPFPKNMFEVYIASGGLQCDIIPRSQIDELNNTVKWAPIRSRKHKFTESCKEIWEVTEESDGFCDPPSMRWEFVMTRKERVMEEEELLPKKLEWDGEMEDDVVQLEYSSPPGDILREVVKKRKFEGFPGAMEEEKRVRYTSYKSPMSKVCEYMVLHGRSLATIPEEPVSPGIQLGHLSNVPSNFPHCLQYSNPLVVVYNIPSSSVSMATPSSPLPQPPTTPSDLHSFNPTEIDPLNAVPGIILSVSSLPHILISHLRGSLTHTLLVERALPLPFEGDIILSPNRCIVFCTLAQMTQSLPSMVSSRIDTLANKYRQIEIVVSATSAGQGARSGGIWSSGKGEFCGWLECVRRDRGCGIRLVFVPEEGMLERWIGFLTLNREIDGEDLANCLKVEESDVCTPCPEYLSVRTPSTLPCIISLCGFPSDSHFRMKYGFKRCSMFMSLKLF